MEEPDTGQFHLVHTISYSNQNTRPSLGNPTVPFTMEAKNTTNNTAVAMSTPSVALISDHEHEFNGFRRGISAAATISTANPTPFLTILNPLHWQSKSNNTITKILRVFVSCNHTKEVQIAFYANPKLTAANFTPVNTSFGPLLYDTAATAFTGGTFLFSIPLGTVGQAELDFFEDEYGGMLDPGNWFTAVAVPKSGVNAEVTASVQFTELF